VGWAVIQAREYVGMQINHLYTFDRIQKGIRHRKQAAGNSIHLQLIGTSIPFPSRIFTSFSAALTILLEKNQGTGLQLSIEFDSPRPAIKMFDRSRTKVAMCTHHFKGIKMKDDKTREQLIAELKELRQLLDDPPRAFNRQLQEFLELLPDAALVIDLQGKVIAWNHAMEEMTGISKTDMLGKGDYVYATPFYGEPRPILADLVIKNSEEHIGLYDVIERQDKLLIGEFSLPRNRDGRGARFWARASPLYDKNRDLIGAVELIRDITELKQVKSVLLKREADLEEKASQLKEINTALKVLLKRREEDKKEIEESLLSNVKESILPFLEKLKKTRLDEKQRTYLEIVESQLREIVSPLLKRLSSRFTGLTPMEIKVAKLITEGRTSKEIAEILGVAEQTVLTHRNNLRAKLGLRNEKANLRSHLMSLT
jgi:PAS domain-containing protein/DNA-binding CsgD family transcriptional regulator